MAFLAPQTREKPAWQDFLQAMRARPCQDCVIAPKSLRAQGTYTQQLQRVQTKQVQSWRNSMLHEHKPQQQNTYN